ncbi:hypothetical protein [Paenibacillus sp. YYML68]|uniref:hypothetical protein n=1 Tax=Paenibacillus sp. YYML68 TaxID=2909250 RepID=UPI002492F107|nr:hypothetical protein [Paenibacillus sp. YYML68]
MISFAESFLCLIRTGLIRQMRSYAFLIVVGLSLFLSYACVPAATAGYEVFYIGGVRGIYNSAWLGGMVAMLSTLLLWLFGFYMLRSQISEDGRLRIGQIIAATPISNLRYITIKALSNLVVLLVIELILIVGFMAMQLLRGEEMYVSMHHYLLPFLYLALPSLIVLAALTVFFDVCPGLQGVVGNIMFFVLWIFFSVMSIAAPNAFWDLFGLDVIRSDMVQEAALTYEFIANSEEGGSFGYYPVEGAVPTFVWQGVDWSIQLLMQRLIWVMLAAVLVLLTALLFNRFKKQKSGDSGFKLPLFEEKGAVKPRMEAKHEYKLSPLERTKRIALSRLITAELKLMLKGYSIWWYGCAAALLALSLLVPLEYVRSWLPVVMVWPIAIWSQMGTRDRHYFTQELMKASCPPIFKWMAVWISGIAVTLLFSSGALIQFASSGLWLDLQTWLVGVVFVPTMALALGGFSGSRKLFEVLYMLWWYLGPINDIPYLDFLGASSSYPWLYLLMTLMFLLVSLAGQQLFTYRKQAAHARKIVHVKGRV